MGQLVNNAVTQMETSIKEHFAGDYEVADLGEPSISAYVMIGLWLVVAVAAMYIQYHYPRPKEVLKLEREKNFLKKRDSMRRAHSIRSSRMCVWAHHQSPCLALGTPPVLIPYGQWGGGMGRPLV